jgi:putative ABC transport system permease protein
MVIEKRKQPQPTPSEGGSPSDGRTHLGFFYLVRQNIRRRLRNFITVICVAVVAGTLFSTVLYTNTVNLGLESGFTKLGADMMVVPEGTEVSAGSAMLAAMPSNFYMMASIEDEVAAVPGVLKIAPQLFIKSERDVPYCTTRVCQLVAIDPEKDFTITPWLSKPLHEPLGKYELIAGANIVGDVGDTVIIEGKEFKIKAKIDQTGLGIDKIAFMTLDTAYEIYKELDNQISTLIVKVDPELGKWELTINIEQNIPKVDVFHASTVAENVKKQTSGIVTALLLLTSFISGMSILLINAMFSMVVNERRGEIGLLRAIGATGSFVFRLIMSEAVLLAVIGGAIGIAGGGALLHYINGLTMETQSIPLVWPNIINIGLLAGVCLGAAVAIGIIASFFPALSSARIEPYEAIRQGYGL